MSFHRIVMISLLAAAGSVAAQTQTPAPAAATSSVAASAPKAQDCAKGATKRHDHGAERNVGSTVPNPCATAVSSSGVKAKKNHDHAKVHNK